MQICFNATLLPLALFASCQPKEVTPPPIEERAADSEAVLPAEYEAQLTAFAEGYTAWHKVDDLMHWAPQLCKLPAKPALRPSRSTDEETHGRKLYYLYARHRDAYLSGGSAAEQIGQVLVKEAFLPAHVDGIGANYVEPGDPHGLFLMARVDPSTPGTDDGWIYATFDAGSSKPTQAGRIESCMECHVRVGAGRLFGLPEDDRETLVNTARPSALDRLLTDIPEMYREWKRVDQEVRISPTQCRMPNPGVGRISESKDDATHGRKLYYLYAREREAYLKGGDAAEAVGQVVVKEAWQPVPSNRPGGAYALHPDTHLPPTKEIDGQRYETGAFAGLYVMLRLDPATPNTDDGWVYATYPADGSPATVGRLANCMDCHVREGRGRLYGMDR
jgi:hypothetical protein